MMMLIFSSVSQLHTLIRCDRVLVPVNVSSAIVVNPGAVAAPTPSPTASLDSVAAAAADAGAAATDSIASSTPSESQGSRVVVDSAAAAAASSSSTPSSGPLVDVKKSSAVKVQAQCRYYIMDLGSPNGTYLNGIKIARKQWTQLREGARLRFAPRTLLAKNYIVAAKLAHVQNNRLASIAAGGSGAIGTFPSVTVSMPSAFLSIQDVHIEYVFEHKANVTNSGPAPSAPAPSASASAAPPTPAPTGAAIDNNPSSSSSLSSSAPPPLRKSTPKRARVQEKNHEDAQSTTEDINGDSNNNNNAKRPRLTGSQETGGPAITVEKQSKIPDVFKQFACGICSDIIYKFVVLNCGHAFCGGCLGEWLEHKKVSCSVRASNFLGLTKQNETFFSHRFFYISLLPCHFPTF